MGTDESVIASGERRKCPECAELILTEARKCRFCGADVREAGPPGHGGQLIESADTQAELKKYKNYFLIIFGVVLVIFGAANANRVSGDEKFYRDNNMGTLGLPMEAFGLRRAPDTKVPVGVAVGGVVLAVFGVVGIMGNRKTHPEQ
jgi:hypothetical protein